MVFAVKSRMLAFIYYTHREYGIEFVKSRLELYVVTIIAIQ